MESSWCRFLVLPVQSVDKPALIEIAQVGGVPERQRAKIFRLGNFHQAELVRICHRIDRWIGLDRHSCQTLIADRAGFRLASSQALEYALGFFGWDRAE